MMKPDLFGCQQFALALNPCEIHIRSILNQSKSVLFWDNTTPGSFVSTKKAADGENKATLVRPVGGVQGRVLRRRPPGQAKLNLRESVASKISQELC